MRGDLGGSLTEEPDNESGEVPPMRGDLGGSLTEEQVAGIHYEIWKLTNDASHRDKAMEMYRALYEKTPKYEYKMRMEEMSAGD